jgi:thiol:disulfide interchange protein
MRKASLVLMALMAVVAALNCGKQPASLDDALALATQSGKPVLIDFYSEW